MTAKVTTLSNGIKIVTDNRDFNNTNLVVMFKAGMINETKEVNGISHFLEHALFLGTDEYDSKQLADNVERLGGNINAYTSFDHTAFIANVLPEHWKIGLKHLSDITQKSVFPEQAFEKEKKVVCEEISRSKDDAESQATRIFLEGAYKNQALGQTILGPEENIKNMSRETLINWWKKAYAKDNMVICACGKIDHDEFVKEVENLFTILPDKNGLTTPKIEFSCANNTERYPLNQTQVVLAWNGPTFLADDKEEMVYNIFGTILDGGMSTRLFQNVREKYGLCYAVWLNRMCLENCGYFCIQAGIEESNLEKTVKLCRETVESMKTDISEEELEKAKNVYLYNLGVMSDKASGLNLFNGLDLLLKGKISNIEELRESVKKVTLDDVFSFANKYVTENYAVGVLLPEKQ